VHLVGFVIRIYHDARSSECQIHIRTHLERTDTLKTERHLNSI